MQRGRQGLLREIVGRVRGAGGPAPQARPRRRHHGARRWTRSCGEAITGGALAVVGQEVLPHFRTDAQASGRPGRPRGRPGARRIAAPPPPAAPATRCSTRGTRRAAPEGGAPVLAAAALTALLLQAQAPPPRAARATPLGYWQQDVRYTIRAAPRRALGRARRPPAGSSTATTAPTRSRAFYVHLYLNAFRPGSRWAESERREGIRRFAVPARPVLRLRAAGPRRRSAASPVAATYPFAPDSTVAGFPLPKPLPPGDSLTVDLEWESRLSVDPAAPGASRPALRLRAVVSRRSWCTTGSAGRRTRSTWRASSTASSAPTTSPSTSPADQVVRRDRRARRGRSRAGPAARATPADDRHPAVATGTAPSRRGRPGRAGVRRRQAGRKRVRFYAEQGARLRLVAATRTTCTRRGATARTVLRTLYLPAGPRHVGRRSRRSRGWRALLALDGHDLRRLPVAAVHGAAPHRGRRHRVPDGGDERRAGRGADLPRGRAPVPVRHPRQQRVEGRLAGRGVHLLPERLALPAARRGRPPSPAGRRWGSSRSTSTAGASRWSRRRSDSPTSRSTTR